MPASPSNGFTIYLDIKGASIGSMDNLIQTINAGSTVESVAGISQIVAAVTGPIPGLGLVTNTVALTLAGVTSDPNGATPGQIISAVGNVVAIVGGAFAIAGVSVPVIAVAGLVLTVGGAAYNFYDAYQKLKQPNASIISPTTNTAYTSALTWSPPQDPLVLDLNGGGLTTVGIDPVNPILFDHNADGVRTGTGWLGAGEGILTLDINGNSTVDSGRELFGDNTILTRASNPRVGQTAANGFDALADLDDNIDGKIDSADAVYSQLRIWQDANQDAVSQATELQTLAALGIQSINVTGTASNSEIFREAA